MAEEVASSEQELVTSEDEIVATESVVANELLGADGVEWIIDRDSWMTMKTSIDYTSLNKVVFEKSCTDAHIGQYSFVIGHEISDETNELYAYYDDSDSSNKVLYIHVPGDDTLFAPENMQQFFKNCLALTTITDIDNLNTSKVKDMTEMFYSCAMISSLDLSSFDVTNLETIEMMFMLCLNLRDLKLPTGQNKCKNMLATFSHCNFTTINLAEFDTSSVENMQALFCPYKGETLDLTNFDTSSVTNMFAMFSSSGAPETTNLKNIIGINTLNTSKVQNMNDMFMGCKFTSLDLSNWDTSNVTEMENMFKDCTELTELNLKSFNVKKVSNMSSMFNGCSNLQKINVSCKFDVSNVVSSNSMFEGCLNLVGQNGTTYTDSHIDKEYARVDKIISENEPGYLSDSDAIIITYKKNVLNDTIGDVLQYTDRGIAITIKTNTFTRSDDYNFVNWNTDAEGTGDVYLGDREAIFENSTTLYANWNVSIQYVAGAGTGSDFYDNVSEKTGGIVLSNRFTYAGHEFVNWKNLADGTTYEVGAPINPGRKITLTAQWKSTGGNTDGGNTDGGNKGDNGNNGGDKHNGGGNSSSSGSSSDNYSGVSSLTVFDRNEVIAKNLKVPYVTRMGVWNYDANSNHWTFTITENKIELGIETKLSTLIADAKAKTGDSEVALAMSLYEKSTDYKGLAINGWYHIPYDGNRYAWYYFDTNGYMQTGFKSAYGARYYLHSTMGDVNYGSIDFGWASANGAIYYFNDYGRLCVSGITTDKFVIDSDGRLVGDATTLQTSGITTTINSKGASESLNFIGAPTEYHEETLGDTPIIYAYLLR